jgi:hypothetical protein
MAIRPSLFYEQWLSVRQNSQRRPSGCLLLLSKTQLNKMNQTSRQLLAVANGVLFAVLFVISV